jgi:protein O-GlcNAc transferase
MAGSLLAAAGLPELATRTAAEYEQLARALAADRTRLAAMKAKLTAGRTTSPLFDTARFCRYIESAYAIIRERHRRGEPPASFSVAVE